MNRAAAALGRLGGLVKSERKANAAKVNGKKGGRPKNKKTALNKYRVKFITDPPKVRTYTVEAEKVLQAIHRAKRLLRREFPRRKYVVAFCDANLVTQFRPGFGLVKRLEQS